MSRFAYSPHSKNPIKSWKELANIENDFGGKDEWAFRGQNVLAFPGTSLERHCRNLGLAGRAVADLEVKLVREFGRRYHLYGGSASPPKGHTLEWLALMQHYGTPTRLLDFTYSFFIAAYFAVETANAKSIIWAVNVTQLALAAKKCITTSLPNGGDLIEEYLEARDGAPFRALFMNPKPHRFVYLANPIRLSERLTIQQGLFLAPGDVRASFEDNLRAFPDHKNMVRKIIIGARCRREVLCKLFRLGINRATLFPGLEGFAWSLRAKSLLLKNLSAQDVNLLEQV